MQLSYSELQVFTHVFSWTIEHFLVGLRTTASKSTGHLNKRLSRGQFEETVSRHRSSILSMSPMFLTLKLIFSEFSQISLILLSNFGKCLKICG